VGEGKSSRLGFFGGDSAQQSGLSKAAAVSMLPNITSLRATLRFIAATLPRELSQKDARNITIPSLSLRFDVLAFVMKAAVVTIAKKQI
jgi:hypothetical protein